MPMLYLDSPVNSVGVIVSSDAVAFSILYTPEEMQKLQDDDPAIGPVLQAVGSGNYPSEDVVKSWSWEGRCLLQQSKMLHACIRRGFV